MVYGGGERDPIAPKVGAGTQFGGAAVAEIKARVGGVAEQQAADRRRRPVVLGEHLNVVGQVVNRAQPPGEVLEGLPESFAGAGAQVVDAPLQFQVFVAQAADQHPVGGQVKGVFQEHRAAGHGAVEVRPRAVVGRAVGRQVTAVRVERVHRGGVAEAAAAVEIGVLVFGAYHQPVAALAQVTVVDAVEAVGGKTVVVVDAGGEPVQLPGGVVVGEVFRVGPVPVGVVKAQLVDQPPGAGELIVRLGAQPLAVGGHFAVAHVVVVVADRFVQHQAAAGNHVAGVAGHVRGQQWCALVGGGIPVAVQIQGGAQGEPVAGLDQDAGGQRGGLGIGVVHIAAAPAVAEVGAHRHVGIDHPVGAHAQPQAVVAAVLQHAVVTVAGQVRLAGHQVEGAAQGAGAVQHRGRAIEYLHPFQVPGVQVARHQRRVGHAHAVEQIAHIGEPAHRHRSRRAGNIAGGHARGAAVQLDQIAQAELFDVLAVHGAHRGRGLAVAQAETAVGGGGGHRGGGGAVIDAHRVQLVAGGLGPCQDRA